MDRKSLHPLVLSLTIALPAGCGGNTQAEEVTGAAELEPVRRTVFGERTLLFMEHPQLVRGEPARFLAHLTVLATGEPLRTGVVTLEVGSAALRVDAPKRDGLFLPEGSFPEDGRFHARLVVASEQAAETLDLGELVVHASQEAAAQAAAAAQGDEPSDAVPFLMEQQWTVRLLLARAEPRALARRLGVPARIAAPEGAAAVVAAPLGGRLVPPPSDAFPRTGDAVAAGQVLALVEPSLGAPDLAQLRALDLEFDLKALDVIRALGEARARQRFAEQELERLTTLRAEGLSTRQQVELAEQNLAVARNEAEAATGMQASLDALVASRGGRPGTPAVQFPLSAPIAGTLVEVRHVQGESVGPDAAVFRILDSSRLWVEGRVLEFDLPLVHAATGAVATVAALPAQRFELAAEPYVGQEVDPVSRTLLVRYALDDPGLAKVGMLAELELATESVAAAVAVPFDAIVFDQGLPTAYVMLDGELFQRRALELGVRDGGWVEVRRGIEAGERLATHGAYLVRLASLSPATFGAGHAH